MCAFRIPVFRWLASLLLVAATAAQAASYDFPLAMPPGCSGSNGVYTCSTSALASSDTVSISGTKPATVTFSGDLALNGAKINQGGSAGDLNLVVTGLLTPGYQAVVNASLSAGEVRDDNGAVVFGGSISTNKASVQLAYASSVAGDITSAGDVALADQVVVRGNVSAYNGLKTGFRSQVGGNLRAGDGISVGQEATVAGTVTVPGSGPIDIGYGATVSGDISSKAGAVTLAQNAVALACVQSADSSRTLRLDYQARAAAVCCGAVGSCSSSCVRNDSSYTMPALCAVPSGFGLTARYYSNMTLTEPPALVRVDSTVAFNWGTGKPDTTLPADNFSVRWTGFVKVPTTGSYQFQTNSDDGVRLWVDGRLVIDNWTVHAPKLDNSAAVTLTAGINYTITMEYFERGGGAVAGLNWLRPGDKAYSTIPAGTFGGSGLFTSPAPTLLASFDFNESRYAGTSGELKDAAGHASGPFNGKAQGSALPTVASTSPARSGSPGTCTYASLPGPASNGGGFIIGGLPVSTTAGDKTTVAFWMYWDGTNGTMPIGWQAYDLWFQNGGFGFNTNVSDVYGIANASLSKVWRHVVAVFTNGNVTANKLYIDGAAQTLSHRTTSTNPNTANAVVGSTLRIGGFGASTNYRMAGAIDQVRVYNGELSQGAVALLYAETATCAVLGPHHLEIQHASGTGLTCTPSTVTVKACADAACSSDYTGGVSGTLGATGGSVTWPATAAFNIAAGSGTTTVSLQATTTTPTVLGVASSSPAASDVATCNFGSPACTFTAADAGFVFDVNNHVSELAQSVSISAVRKSDSSTACTPAFASTSKAVSFSCGYTNPTSGTLPVRVGGTALNSSANAAAACDANGRAVSLAFNASGVASTTVQYADVGQVLLSARYAGAAGGSEAGLVMTGSDSFIAAPHSFSISGINSGPIKAGSSFAATVTARNSAGAAAPNHGRETSAQGVTLAWVRLQPSGSGAVSGSFSGSLGAFANGAASASNLIWTEVGRGDLLARSNNTAGYLGSGLRAFGSSLGAGAVDCAAENGSCVLPGGTTATVYYGENGSYAVKAAQTGTVACSNGNFGDPLQGTVKRCFYVPSTASNGSVGDFIPHRFTVSATHACGSFSYAGQPIATTVTAQNAAGNTTLNFNGTATTTPSFAQVVTLADANGLGLGTLSGASIAAAAFSAGVASATPSYAFTSKTTAPQSLVLRASNGGSGASLISSQGYAEPTLPLRSGRLRLSNSFGKAAAALQMPVVAEYWGGSAWLLNSADSCTALAGASVALSNPRGPTGSASAATSSAGALAISNGNGSISLAAPNPAGSSLSLDLALNLGSLGTDQSCNANKPATAGAGLPWLRAQNGSCAATADRDPSARASFGIYAPETRKTVHVRDLY